MWYWGVSPHWRSYILCSSGLYRFVVCQVLISGSNDILPPPFGLKEFTSLVKVETLVFTYQATRCNNGEDRNIKHCTHVNCRVVLVYFMKACGWVVCRSTHSGPRQSPRCQLNRKLVGRQSRFRRGDEKYRVFCARNPTVIFSTLQSLDLSVYWLHYHSTCQYADYTTTALVSMLTTLPQHLSVCWLHYNSTCQYADYTTTALVSMLTTLQQYLSVYWLHCKSTCQYIDYTTTALASILTTLNSTCQYTDYITTALVSILITLQQQFSVYWLHYNSSCQYTDYTTTALVSILTTLQQHLSIYWLHYNSTCQYTDYTTTALVSILTTLQQHLSLYWLHYNSTCQYTDYTTTALVNILIALQQHLSVYWLHYNSTHRKPNVCVKQCWIQADVKRLRFSGRKEF